MIPEWKPIEEPKIPKAVWYVVPVVIAGAALGGYLYYTNQAAPPPPAVKAAPLPAPVAEPPAIAHPIPQDGDVARAALPLLNESDTPLHDSLAKLVNGKSLDQLLVPQNLVRNIVVTVDNLPRSKTAVERRPEIGRAHV